MFTIKGGWQHMKEYNDYVGMTKKYLKENPKVLAEIEKKVRDKVAATENE